MPLPAQVQDQIDEVNSYYNPDEPEGTEPPVEETPVEETPTDAPVDQQDPPVEEHQEEDFEHKYRTLQGLFNKNMRDLRGENDNLRGRLQEMEGVLASIQTAPVAAPTPAQSGLITDKDVQEFGEDTIDMIRRATREEMQGTYQAEISRLNQQVQALSQLAPQVQHLAGATQNTGYSMFLRNLTDMVPDWQQHNENPDFLTWLEQPEIMSGKTRRELLGEAYQSHDAARTSQFFEMWKRERGIAEPAPPATGRPNAGGNPASELANQINPGKGRSLNSADSSQKPSYTADDIKQFYNDIAHGAYKGRDEERAQRERDIFLAQKEGRIT